MEPVVSSVDGLRRWLSKRPPEYAQLIATRIALRVFPFVFAILEATDDPIVLESQQSVLLQNFRTAFVSWAACKYSSPVIQGSAADAAIAVAGEGLPRTAMRNTGAAANVPSHLVLAASAAADAGARAAAATGARAAAHDAAIGAAENASVAVHAVDPVFGPEKLWNAIAVDCRDMEAQGVAGAIERPLWPLETVAGSPTSRTTPGWSRAYFDGLAESELGGTAFELITTWYQAVAFGSEIRRLHDLFGEVADREIAAKPDEFWKVTVNRSAGRIMDEVAGIAGWELDIRETVSIPPQSPASVRPLWAGDRVVQDSSALPALSGNDLGLANLQALREEMLDLAQSIAAEQNIDRRPGIYIAATADLITAELPTSATLFRLMRREAALVEYKVVVDEQWPDFLSRRYRAVLNDFTEALDQFEDRRRFSRSSLEIDVETLSAKEIADDTAAVVQQMRSDSGVVLIDESVPSTIEAIAPEKDEPPLPEGSGVDLVRNLDQLESINNTLKRLAERADDDPEIKSMLQQMNEAYLSEFKAGLIVGAAEAGRSDGQVTAKGLMRGQVAASAAKIGSKKLTDRYPRLFRWLKRYVPED